RTSCRGRLVVKCRSVTTSARRSATSARRYQDLCAIGGGLGVSVSMAATVRVLLAHLSHIGAWRGSASYVTPTRQHSDARSCRFVGPAGYSRNRTNYRSEVISDGSG